MIRGLWVVCGRLETKRWAILLAYGSSRGVMTIWDALKSRCLKVVLFSVQ